MRTAKTPKKKKTPLPKPLPELFNIDDLKTIVSVLKKEINLSDYELADIGIKFLSYKRFTNINNNIQDMNEEVTGAIGENSTALHRLGNIQEKHLRIMYPLFR